jgi:hypothetical protein
MVSVYDGRDCLGFIIRRGVKGFEAFSANEESLGLFLNECDALDAVTNTAAGDS